MTQNTENPTPHRLYGRRMGRRLHETRSHALETGLPELGITLPENGGGIDPFSLFHMQVSEVWLEVGFGNGEHLIEQLKANPNVGIIGCEPFMNGVSALLNDVPADMRGRLAIYPDDAAALLDRLPENCISRTFVLFPDPWPKKRHRKRRFIREENLDRLARTMKDDAELRMGTDIRELGFWMFIHTARHGAFHFLQKGPHEWRRRTPDWPETRYEQKGIAAGRRPVYLRFARNLRQRP
ncbi:MAG TPA: tRNA (guanosine(46)-N7)-methyltransferase TrmB [Rhodospirillaceae bacterium]|nr:MAG: tRNA (guanosine(46)-N7)-methyltransferase TrmB [Alphaproteobacteria bacterium GWF2_58_20]HAU28800.1 tRNA (guanosine(46)-N7)-methyltransferase TrmB [Rhodospirillaceae bacterium]